MTQDNKQTPPGEGGAPSFGQASDWPESSPAPRAVQAVAPAGRRNAAMTRSEREDLQRLVRQREKVLKSAAKARSADLMVDFECQMAAEYQPQDDPVWLEAEREAAAAVAEAKRANTSVSRVYLYSSSTYLKSDSPKSSTDNSIANALASNAICNDLASMSSPTESTS